MKHTRAIFPRPILLLAAVLACGCDAPPRGDPDAPAVRVATEPADTAAHLARMTDVIRRDAEISYGQECPRITIPDAALIPVEITGGGLPELAVTFGPVRCGQALTRFSGTGGVMVQFWIGSGGPVRLLLEQQMHGFSPRGDSLVTMQHGSYCPGGGGPDQCRVTYRWNGDDRRLEVVERRLASSLGTVQPMDYDWERLSREP